MDLDLWRSDCLSESPRLCESYAAAVDAGDFYPLHQDLGKDPTASSAIRAKLSAEFAKRSELRTRLRWLQDPRDYLRPIVINPSARQWQR